jgi:O-succinylbenzoic acid--CoA ligase
MTRDELKTLVEATGCAEEHGGFTFLLDPKLGAAERAALAIVTSRLERRPTSTKNGWLCIPTGGTSGGVRFARHDESTLSAAARGFCAHFGLEQVNAVDVLPPYHVSGLMARVRCATTGGEHVGWEWKRLEKGARPELKPKKDGWVISLVPTQLARLLEWPDLVTWLRSFKVIFLGGGPVWAKLAEAAGAERLPISVSYGMTETAAMVTALRPEEFLAGTRSCGTPLPHAQITLDADGVISIAGDSVFRGYFPHEIAQRKFTTEDMGRFDEQGQLHVLGRRDAVIITGGKKVHPAEVEAALRASNEFADVAVVGVPDAEWGEAIVACYLAKNGGEPNLDRATYYLAGYQKPKRFVAIADWPRNAQGKINRAALFAAAMKSAQ